MDSTYFWLDSEVLTSASHISHIIAWRLSDVTKKFCSKGSRSLQYPRAVSNSAALRPAMSGSIFNGGTDNGANTGRNGGCTKLSA